MFEPDALGYVNWIDIAVIGFALAFIAVYNCRNK